ncbi:MAG: cation:proton antiporter family protein [Methylophaga sp.]|nr:cation:proton antiporter family protein [Methylophaga sp.]
MALIEGSAFFELTALLALAAVAGLIGLLLRQPMIVSFIAVGVLAGPSALNIVQSHDNIELLAELGIALLLFLVGLKLDLKLIRSVGPVALATGLGQVLFTAIFGFIIGLLLGLDWVAALYVAIALTFSSTIIIVKLLSDKREVDALHGRIAIGFLIVQDLFVILAMMALSAYGIGGDAGNSPILQILTVLFYGLIMLALVGVFMRFIATPLVNHISHSPELLVIFAIGWATLLASLGEYFGFGKELGGLLAGISLASTPYREAIVARLSSLRDFLLLFFFIALGTELDLSLLGDQVGPALVFSLFVLIGNPLIVLAIMGYMGYRKRTGFLAGLTVAQISEFSLIFMAMGVSLGHVTNSALGLVTLVGLVTIALSVYMITYSHTLFRWCEPLLGIFERRHAFREHAVGQHLSPQNQYDVIIFGLGRYGAVITERFQDEGKRVLAVDFNPDVVKRWRQRGFDIMYGDASDMDFIEMLPLQSVRWVICAMPQHDLGVTHEDPRIVLLDALKQQHYQGKVAVSTHFTHDIPSLQQHGADLVLQPYHDAADQAVERIRAASV